MMKSLTRILGLAPEAPKTGAREAALFIFICVLFLTVFAILKGTEMVSAMTGVLVVMWPSAFAYMGFAFKLKADQQRAGNDRDKC